MKNLQTRFLEFYLFALFFFVTVSGNSQTSLVHRADSLFKAKKYTQSLEMYQAFLQQGKYSPSMLLKMAYIQEGLGHIGQSLYCLRLYQKATNDQQAIEKMQELAAKYNLAGYEENDSNLFYRWMERNIIWVELTFVLLIAISTSVIFFQYTKKKIPYVVLGFNILLVTSVFYLNNLISIDSVITKEKVYLMEGPSAGSSVKGILNDGNQLQVVGKEDVWLKVKWEDKIVFVKENLVLKLTL